MQGCLSICRKQTICKINEDEALILGQVAVEKNQTLKNREGGQLDWKKIAGNLADLLLGMFFCWVVSFLAKAVMANVAFFIFRKRAAVFFSGLAERGYRSKRPAATKAFFSRTKALSFSCNMPSALD